MVQIYSKPNIIYNVGEYDNTKYNITKNSITLLIIIIFIL